VADSRQSLMKLTPVNCTNVSELVFVLDMEIMDVLSMALTFSLFIR